MCVLLQTLPQTVEHMLFHLVSGDYRIWASEGVANARLHKCTEFVDSPYEILEARFGVAGLQCLCETHGETHGDLCISYNRLGRTGSKGVSL